MPVVEVFVYDRDSGKAVGFGVMVCLESYCSPTDFQGKARLVVPKGSYLLTVGGGAYDIVREKVTIDRDKRFKIGLRRILL